MTSLPHTAMLIVEDEEPFRRVYRDILQSHGYTLLEAEDGEKGWEMIQEHRPVVVLLDMVLPKLTGIEVLEKMRQDPATKDIPVIMLTVIGDEKTIQKCLNAGADEYAVKGMFTPHEIIGMIENLSRGRHTEKGSTKKVVSKGKMGRPEVKTVERKGEKKQ